MNGSKVAKADPGSSRVSRVRSFLTGLTSGRVMALVAWVSLWLLATLTYLGGPGRLPFAKIAAREFDVGVAIQLVSVILVVLLIWVAFALTWKGLKAVAAMTSPPRGPDGANGEGQQGKPGGGAGEPPAAGTQAQAGQDGGTPEKPGGEKEKKREGVGFPAPPTVAVAIWLVLVGVLLTLGLIQAVASVFPIGEYFQSVVCVGEGSCTDLHNILVTMFAAGVGAVITTTLGFLEHASEKRDFDPAFVPWFIARPILGVLLGAVFYFVLKGGLLATVGSQNASSIDEYGLAAFGALVGMFSKRAITKLRELFDTLFVTKKEGGEGGDGKPKAPTVPKPPGNGGATNEDGGDGNPPGGGGS